MDNSTNSFQRELKETNEKLSQLNDQHIALKHQYQSDKKAILLAATVFSGLTLAFFGLSFYKIGEVVNETGFKAALNLANNAAETAETLSNNARLSADSIAKIEKTISQDADKLRLKTDEFSQILKQETLNIKEHSNNVRLTETYFEENAKERLKLLNDMVKKLINDHRAKSNQSLSEWESEVILDLDKWRDTRFRIIECIADSSKKEICSLPSGLEIYSSCFECFTRKGRIKIE